TTGQASCLANCERRVAATGDAELRALADQVLAALDGYATLPAGDRATRLEAALGLLGEESGVRSQELGARTPAGEPTARPYSDPASAPSRGVVLPRPPGSNSPAPSQWGGGRGAVGMEGPHGRGDVGME